MYDYQLAPHLGDSDRFVTSVHSKKKMTHFEKENQDFQ